VTVGGGGDTLSVLDVLAKQVGIHETTTFYASCTGI
jgi:hypothetical protein